MQSKIQCVVVVAVLLASVGCGRDVENFNEANIAELHDRMQRGDLRSEQLVQWYLERIEAIDHGGPSLNAIIELNPDALMTARALDEEWQGSGPRGPLHGIPIVIKANIDTADKLHTSAGSLALAEHVARDDAYVVSLLRDAGVVIIGKANLSEWANFRSTRSTSGWSSVGGQTRNPYDILRNPCGSSSGSAVAVTANLATVSIGTETDGSVICPSGINGIVGIKPTVGLVSRSGIIPIAHSQDTAGPMARTVRDAAILLTAMTGIDPSDPASTDVPLERIDYAANLAADGLQGKRIGVLRSYYGAGSNPQVEAVMQRSIDAIVAAGADLTDDIEIDMGDASEAEYQVLLFEFKTDLGQYLQESGAAHDSLAEIIDFNEANKADVMPLFGQDILLAAEEKESLENPEYLQALETSQRNTRDRLDAVFAEHELDALVAITNGPAWMTDHANGDSFHIGSSSYAAISGYPNITVPAGFASDLPIGLSFIGKPFAEQSLLEIAYAFEQTTLARQPPKITDAVTNSTP